MAAALEYGSQGSAASSSGTATIAGLDFNTATSDRIIAASLAIENTAGSVSISGCTIGGVTAALGQAGNQNGRRAEIWTAAVPTGTSGDVVVTLAGGDTTVSAATYSVTGADATLTDTDVATGSGASIAISALTIPSDGVGLAAWCNASTTGSVAWTGAAEDHDTNVGGAFRHSSASVTTIGTNTITADGDTSNQALVGVAWGPAAGGATDYTADLTAGSFSVTGSSLTVPTARNADLTAGSFAVTGSSLSVPTGRNADLTAGSFAVTGSDVDGVYVDNGAPVAYEADLSPGVFSVTGSSIEATATGQEQVSYGDLSHSPTFSKSLDKRRKKQRKEDDELKRLLKRLLGEVPEDAPEEIEKAAQVAQATVERVTVPEISIDVGGQLKALQTARLQLAKLEAMIRAYEESEDEDDLLLAAA